MNHISAKVDLSDFLPRMERYIKETSKSVKDAINSKLFDLARFSLKDTDKAKPATIRDALNAKCNRYPEVSLKEMIVIIKKRDEGKYDLKAEADKLLKTRSSHSAYVKSGWIKPMVKLLPYIGKTAVTANDVPKSIIGQGGAEPVINDTGILHGSVFNDTKGGVNGEHFKEVGAQSAVNKVVADMDVYFNRKLQQAADKTMHN